MTPWAIVARIKRYEVGRVLPEVDVPYLYCVHFVVVAAIIMKRSRFEGDVCATLI
jgi:hypothetical protein